MGDYEYPFLYCAYFHLKQLLKYSLNRWVSMRVSQQGCNRQKIELFCSFLCITRKYKNKKKQKRQSYLILNILTIYTTKRVCYLNNENSKSNAYKKKINNKF